MNEKTESRRMRLDKWLWAARFYKTRGLAVEAIDKGRVQVNGQAAKRARELRVGDLVALRERTTRLVHSLDPCVACHVEFDNA